jgi:hypothetical protein
MNAKTLFLQDAEATKFMLGVVKSPMFEKAMIYARLQWMEGNAALTTDQMAGVTCFLGVLRDLPIDEPEPAIVKGPNLHHDIDTPTRTPKDKKKGTK